MHINHVLALRDYLYESSERSAGSALRGKPTADRRPHPLCVVQPLGRAQHEALNSFDSPLMKLLARAIYAIVGVSVEKAIAPITHLIDNPPHTALSAFIKTKPVDLTMNTFDRGKAVRLDDITKSC